LKKIVITDKIEQEFLKCFINTFIDNRKYKKKKLEDLKFVLEYIDFDSNYDIIYNGELPLPTTQVFKDFARFIENEFRNKNINFTDIFFSNNIDLLSKKYGKYNKDKEKAEVKKAYQALRNKWGYKIVKLTQTDVCPYCNRNFTFNFNEKETTVELDHYYPKEKYPYLALNLYNLVPSCHTCNHKKTSSDKFIYTLFLMT